MRAGGAAPVRPQRPPTALCDGGGVTGGEGAVEVRLLGLPLRHRARLSVHVEGLLRELALVRVGEAQGAGGSWPARLLELAVDLDTTYAPYRAQRAGAMDAALAAGEEFFDAVYAASPLSAGWVAHLDAVLEEADDFCRAQQHLLTLPTPAELVAFRRWMFAEILGQLRGEAPHPWPGSRRGERPAPATSPGGPAVPAAAPAAPRTTPGTVAGAPLVVDVGAGAVSQARRYVRRVLRELDAAHLEESGELAVSELVTNAVLHAGTPSTVTVRTTPAGGVRVEVSDTSPAPVQTRHHGPAATTGRGLQLVAAVSSAWGVEVLPERSGPGKCVWFEPRAVPVETTASLGDWADELAELR